MVEINTLEEDLIRGALQANPSLKTRVGAGMSRGIGLLELLAPLVPSKWVQEYYQNEFDPEFSNARKINTARQLGSQLSGLGQPPVNTPSYPIQKYQGYSAFPDGGVAFMPMLPSQFGNFRADVAKENQRLAQLSEQEAEIKKRYATAKSDWSQFEDMVAKQNENINNQMASYRSEYKRKYGVMPSAKEAAAYRLHLRRLNRDINPGDVLRSQYDNDGSGTSEFRNDLPSPRGGIGYSYGLLSRKTGDKIFLPNMKNVPAGIVW